MSHLILTLLFIAAAVFYYYSAVVCHRRGDALKWPRLATAIGFTLMAIGFIVAEPAAKSVTFIGAIVVFVSAITTAVLSARRSRA